MHNARNAGRAGKKVFRSNSVDDLGDVLWYLFILVLEAQLCIKFLVIR